MRSFKLAVYDSSAILIHKFCKKYQRQFACTWHQRKHALAKEAAPDGHTIQSAHQVVVVVPHFHAGSKSLAMQLLICRHHILAQPCSLLVVSQPRALSYHPIESLVHTHAIFAFIEQIAHRVRNMNLRREYHKPLHRTIPHYLWSVSKRIPGEYSVAICQQQPVHRQVAAHGYQSVIVAISWIRKCQLLSYSVYHFLMFNV